MTWTKETEEKYRLWHKERYGVEPPEVNLPKKEENMTAGDQNKEMTLTEAIGRNITRLDALKISQDVITKAEAERNLISVKPKQHRRHKGIPPGVSVETYREATIHITIPARPEGMTKVTIRFVCQDVKEEDETFLIDWPEGKTAKGAISQL